MVHKCHNGEQCGYTDQRLSYSTYYSVANATLVLQTFLLTAKTRVYRCGFTFHTEHTKKGINFIPLRSNQKQYMIIVQVDSNFHPYIGVIISCCLYQYSPCTVHSACPCC